MAVRARLLGVAEVTAWIAVGFTVFLGLRMGSIFLDQVVPAQCEEICNLGGQVVPLGLFTFGLGWFPPLLVHFVRLARRGIPPWYAIHAFVVVFAHVAGMVMVIRVIDRYGGADSRTTILAAGAAAFDALTGVLLGIALLSRHGEPAA